MTSRPSVPPVSPSPRNIMIIGDNPTIESVVADCVPFADWHLLRAADNSIALAIAEKCCCELILTNRKSSGGEGVSLLRSLQHRQSKAKLIILAAESRTQDVVQAMRGCAFSYFSRSYSDELLAEMLRWAVEAVNWEDGIEIVSGLPNWLQARVRCDFDSADRFLQFLRELIAGVPAEVVHSMMLSAREILLNAVEYGGALDSRKTVEYSCFRTSRFLACVVRDPGEGFRLHDLPQAAIQNPLENPTRHVTYRLEHGLRPGGFGILMAKQHLDELVYNEKGNEALLIKYI